MFITKLKPIYKTIAVVGLSSFAVVGLSSFLIKPSFNKIKPSFNEPDKNKLYKVINFDKNHPLYKYKNKHNGFNWKIGLNIDVLPFNNDINDICGEGGLYFITHDNVKNFINYGTSVCKVKIPDDATYLFDNEYIGRANKLIIEDSRSLYDIDVIREFKLYETIEFIIDIIKLNRNDIFKEFANEIFVHHHNILAYIQINGMLDIILRCVEVRELTNIECEHIMLEAMIFDHVHIIDYLIKKKHCKLMYLHLAVYDGNIKIIEWCINNNLDNELKNCNGFEQIIEKAIKTDNKIVLKWLDDNKKILLKNLDNNTDKK